MTKEGNVMFQSIIAFIMAIIASISGFFATIPAKIEETTSEIKTSIQTFASDTDPDETNEDFWE